MSELTNIEEGEEVASQTSSDQTTIGPSTASYPSDPLVRETSNSKTRQIASAPRSGIITVAPARETSGTRRSQPLDWSTSPYTQHLLHPHGSRATGGSPAPGSSNSGSGTDTSGRPSATLAVLFEPEQVIRASPHGGTESSLGSINLNSGHVVVQTPPVGHHSDFRWTVPKRVRLGSLWGTGESDAEEAFEFEEESLGLGDNATLLGQLNSALGFNKSDTLRNKENRVQAKNAIRLADNIIKVPLSKVWHTFTEVFVNLVFLVNVAVAISDNVIGPEFFYYKATALVFGILEICVTGIVWLVRRSKKFKQAKDYEKRLKKMQYFENLLSEVLVYPLLILTVVGFATEKMYETPSEPFGWVQLILLILDIAQLIYTQVVRMYMLYRLMKDLRKVFLPEETLEQRAMAGYCGRWSLADHILPRAYHTIVGNLVTMLLLLALFGLQVNRDNDTSGDYHLTVRSGCLMICFILLPNLNVLLFVGANIYSIFELLITINLNIGGNRQFQKDLADNYGEFVADSLEYTREKIPTCEKRLATITEASRVKKMLYGVTEVTIVASLFVWQVLLVSTVFFFDGFTEPDTNFAMKVTFLVVFVVANPHVAALMLLSNFLVIGLLLGLLIYPIFLPFCLRRKKIVTKQK